MQKVLFAAAMLLTSPTFAQGSGGQVDALETAFGPLEFGGTMYRFAIPVMSLAFLMLVGQQFLQMREGQKPDWGKPFVRIVGFILLLTAYGPFASGVIGAVKMAGNIQSAFTEITTGSGSRSTEGVLARRAKEFQALRERLDTEMKVNSSASQGGLLPSSEDIALMTESLMTSAIDDLLYVITWFTFTFAAFAIFALKTLSAAITNILLEVGPLMIAFAALPGLTTRYLAAWVLALIEVTAWGPIAGIVLSLLARVNEKSAGLAILEDANYAEHIVLNFVYAGLFLAVPAITHMILSGSASVVGSTGMAAAVGGLAASGKKAAGVAGAAKDRMVGAGTTGAAAAAGGALGAKLAGAGAGGRIGDDGPSPTHSSSGPDMRAVHARRAAIAKQRRGDD